MKKDLNILKTLEFPSVQSEDDARPLEVLILERSKALQVTFFSLFVFSETSHFPDMYQVDTYQHVHCTIIVNLIHHCMQAENSMLRLDKERLVREVNTTKVPPPTHQPDRPP